MFYMNRYAEALFHALDSL